jgi:hypothetical protein
VTEEMRVIYTDREGNIIWPRPFSAREAAQQRPRTFSEREHELLTTIARGEEAQRLLDAHEEVLYAEHARQLGLREVTVEEDGPDAEDALYRAHAEFLGIRP